MVSLRSLLFKYQLHIIHSSFEISYFHTFFIEHPESYFFIESFGAVISKIRIDCDPFIIFRSGIVNNITHNFPAYSSASQLGIDCYFRQIQIVILNVCQCEMVKNVDNEQFR